MAGEADQPIGHQAGQHRPRRQLRRRQYGHEKSMKASTQTGPPPMTIASPSGVAPNGNAAGG